MKFIQKFILLKSYWYLLDFLGQKFFKSPHFFKNRWLRCCHIILLDFLGQKFFKSPHFFKNKWLRCCHIINKILNWLNFYLIFLQNRRKNTLKQFFLLIEEQSEGNMHIRSGKLNGFTSFTIYDMHYVNFRIQV